MLSKLLPWDFTLKFPETIDKKKCGIHAFLIDDPFLERTLLDRLPKKEIPFSLYSGNELTRDFIEEHFINLSFFTSVDHIMILNAETIPSATLDFLLESSIDWSERFLLLFFTKSNKSLVEFFKSNEVNGHELLAPRFWEAVKLWQFCQKMRNVNYDSSITKFAMDNLEPSFETYFWLIETIEQNFSKEKINLIHLQELIKRERFDFFELVDLFHLNPKIFFVEVLKKEMDYEWMRALSVFMQTHLLKVLYPEETKVKAKLSKYDQTILEMAEKLNRDLLKKYVTFFSELEILSKSQDVLLINRLRLELK